MCQYYYISGKVQGVWFRASTRDQAQRLGITGWVRNTPDGKVEVLACGSGDKLRTFEDWLNQGPPLAEVTSVSKEIGECEAGEGFVVR